MTNKHTSSLQAIISLPVEKVTGSKKYIFMIFIILEPPSTTTAPGTKMNHFRFQYQISVSHYILTHTDDVILAVTCPLCPTCPSFTTEPITEPFINATSQSDCTKSGIVNHQIYI